MPHAVESKLLRELLEERACALVFNHEATGTNAVDIKETSKEAKLKKLLLRTLAMPLSSFSLRLGKVGNAAIRHFSESKQDPRIIKLVMPFFSSRKAPCFTRCMLN
jgi:hypothetical protein